MASEAKFFRRNCGTKWWLLLSGIAPENVPHSARSGHRIALEHVAYADAALAFDANLVMRALGSGRCSGSSGVYGAAIHASDRSSRTKAMSVCRAVVFSHRSSSLHKLHRFSASSPAPPPRHRCHCDASHPRETYKAIGRPRRSCEPRGFLPTRAVAQSSLLDGADARQRPPRAPSRSWPGRSLRG